MATILKYNMTAGNMYRGLLLYSSSSEQDRNIYFSGCTYIFWVEETDGSIYKLFYSGNFEIQDGHHIRSNLVNISPAGRDSKLISKCVCSVYCAIYIPVVKWISPPRQHL